MEFKFSYKNNLLPNVFIVHGDKGMYFNTITLQNSDLNLLVVYLNIGIDSDKMAINQLWDLSPVNSWLKRDLNLPQRAIRGSLILEGSYESGHTWRLDADKTWQSYYDARQQWFCISEPEVAEEYLAVAFLPDTIGVLVNGFLKCIWIKVFFPDFYNLCK